MKVAIMQPYFFPYLGYFQLIHSVDTFVIYDDVNYIKRGWVNRNYVLAGREKSRLTLQLDGASQNLQINQIKVGNNREKLVKTIQHGYSRAPYFESAFPLVRDIILCKEINLASYLTESLRKLSVYLGIDVKWLLSSELEKNTALRGQGKIIEICNVLGASQYINLPGGRELYEADEFKKHNIELSFLDPKVSSYSQFRNEFVSHLSIIDVMMFNSQEMVKEFVETYSVVD